MGALADVIGLSVDELQDAYLLETDRARQGQQQIENYQKYTKMVENQMRLEKKYKEELLRLDEEIALATAANDADELKSLQEQKMEIERKIDANQKFVEQQKANLKIADGMSQMLEENFTAQEAFNETVAKLKDRLVEFTTAPVFDKVLIRLQQFADKGFYGLFNKITDEEILSDPNQVIDPDLIKREQQASLKQQEANKELEELNKNSEKNADKITEQTKKVEENNTILQDIRDEIAAQREKEVTDFILSRMGDLRNSQGIIDKQVLSDIYQDASAMGYEEEFFKYFNNLQRQSDEALKNFTSSYNRNKVRTLREGLTDIVTKGFSSNQDGADKDQIIEGTNDFIIRPGQPVQKFRKDDVVLGGTNLLGGGGNNSKVEKKLDDILAAIQAGGNVYIDGNKAGRAMVLATQKLS
jgi:hypothetical protein